MTIVYPADQQPILTLGRISTIPRFSANDVNLGTGVLKEYSDISSSLEYFTLETPVAAAQ